MKILVKNVHIFDGISSRITESANIAIENNLVSDITQEEIPEQGFDDLIDARGYWAIPGLIDAHVHMGATAGFAAIDQMTTDEVVLRAGQLAHDMLYRVLPCLKLLGLLPHGVPTVLPDLPYTNGKDIVGVRLPEDENLGLAFPLLKLLKNSQFATVVAAAH